MTTKICINEGCGNCGWEMNTNETKCSACRKPLVPAEKFYRLDREGTHIK